jgi:hypothetical protein
VIRLARFVSFGRKYIHGVRGEISEPTQFGRHVLVRPLFAQFSEDGRTPYDLEVGAKMLSPHGLPEDSIEGGEVDMRSQLGVFDTEETGRVQQWTEDEKELVATTLRESPYYGLHFVEVLHEEPFAGYATMDPENILQIIDAGLAVDFDIAIAYERENQNREELIAELMARAARDEELVEQPVTIDAS